MKQMQFETPIVRRTLAAGMPTPFVSVINPVIDSAGLRVVLVIARDLRGEYQGDLRVTMLQPAVYKVFEISGLNNVMRIFEDTKTAVQSFSE